MPWKYEYIANADGGGFLKPRSVEVDFIRKSWNGHAENPFANLSAIIFNGNLVKPRIIKSHQEQGH